LCSLDLSRKPFITFHVFESIRARLRPYLPRNIKETLRKRKERDSNHCHVFSLSPPVIYLCWERDDSALHRGLKDQKLTLLYMFPWCTLVEDVPFISRKIRETLKRFPKHRIVLLCNELFTVDLFRAEGLEAIYCNQNCFVNENVFKPDNSAVKQFDAVYNASMALYKRHALAEKVTSLALMTYRYSGTHSADYEVGVRKALAHAKWVKDSYSDDDKVPVEEIVRLYHQSRVGLCLSEIEGSMFVSMEYLLCGIPVVTTRSVGGRDAFFDPEYVLTVEDTPEAVAEGVREMCRRAPSPELIRARTLEKIEVHRDRLREFLRDEVSDIQLPWAPGSHGPMMFMNLRALAAKCRAAAKSTA
jgi:glycosyltransferase involved in cell wall biosynthesis